MPQPHQIATGSASVRANVPCCKCAYNLRTLSIRGRCPECGDWISRSLNADLLHLSPPAYVASLCRNLTATSAAAVGWTLLAFVMPILLAVSVSGGSVNWAFFTLTLSVDRLLTLLVAAVFAWATANMVNAAAKHLSAQAKLPPLFLWMVGVLLASDTTELVLLWNVSLGIPARFGFVAFALDCVQTLITAFVLPLVLLRHLSSPAFDASNPRMKRSADWAILWGLITGAVFVLESIMCGLSEAGESVASLGSWSPLDLLLYVHPVSFVVGIPYLSLAVAVFVAARRSAGRAYVLSLRVWSGG